MSSRESAEKTSVVIIGAGYSGLCTAIDLIRRSKTRDFILIEKGNDVGGTWNDNRYPGCSCDVWSHLYSFSFHPNCHWTREYSSQEEIHSYLIDVAQTWGLYHNIRFGSAVEEAKWNDESKQWEVAVRRNGGKSAEYGETYTIMADFLVSGMGQLNKPYIPNIKGLDTFQGKVMHTARWDNRVSIENTDIVIIGNGASAVQVLPELAKTARSVTLLQRTPNWVIPREDGPISPAMRFVYSWIPGARRRYRAFLMGLKEEFWDGAVAEDSELNKEMRNICLEMMEKQIPNDPDLRARLTPDYPPGCKRILLTDDFYPALCRPNVTLETRRLEEVTASGVRVDGQHYNAALLILATGFETNKFMAPIKMYGENGRSLDDVWAKGARALLGMTVESMPNFGMLYGPNTNLGHNSIVLMIEAQSRYITGLVSEVLEARRRGKPLKITPTKAALDAFNTELQARLSKSTFASANCKSWYKNSEGLVTNNWCGNVVEYQKRASQVVWSDYKLTGNGKDSVIKKKTTKVGRVVEESWTEGWTSKIVIALMPVIGAFVIVRVWTR